MADLENTLTPSGVTANEPTVTIPLRTAEALLRELPDWKAGPTQAAHDLMVEITKAKTKVIVWRGPKEITDEIELIDLTRVADLPEYPHCSHDGGYSE